MPKYFYKKIIVAICPEGGSWGCQRNVATLNCFQKPDVIEELKEPVGMEDRVVHGIMKAWSSLREGLVLMQPKSWDELLRQSLF